MTYDSPLHEEMRKVHASYPSITYKRLAKMFGMSEGGAYRAINRKSYGPERKYSTDFSESGMEREWPTVDFSHHNIPLREYNPITVARILSNERSLVGNAAILLCE